MTKKILCIGDSFTYGDDLENPEIDSWPAVLANDNGHHVTNMGFSGGSLDRCIRILFENIDDQYDLVIFGCPPWVRQETYFLLHNKPIEIGTHKTVRVPWEDSFYKFSYEDLYYYKKWLMNIIQVQSFLKQSNQKYLMHVTYQLLVEEYKIKCSSLLNKIDTNYFLEPTLFELVKSFPLSATRHPLKEGHRHLATFIQKKIAGQMLN